MNEKIGLLENISNTSNRIRLFSYPALVHPTMVLRRGIASLFNFIGIAKKFSDSNNHSMPTVPCIVPCLELSDHTGIRKMCDESDTRCLRLTEVSRSRESKSTGV